MSPRISFRILFVAVPRAKKRSPALSHPAGTRNPELQAGLEQ